MGLIDTHTHLDGFDRARTLPAVLTRARAAGVEAMIAIGTAPDDWTLNQGYARGNPGWVHYTVGLHPCEVTADWESAQAQVAGFWSGDLMPVALGEIGLDRFHLPTEAAEAEIVFARQKAAFTEGLALAKRLDCPVVIHSRGAFAECVAMIDASSVDWRKIVFHCFAEGEAEAKVLMGRGGFASFTGILTYKNAPNVCAAAKAQGLARLMVETDAPYLTPMPNRGKPNEPAFVRHTAEFAAAEVFGVSYDELAAVTTANARKFFGL